MERGEMIPIHDFCLIHNIEVSFIYSLQESGLIDIVSIEERKYVPESQLLSLEKMLRLRQEMGINLEGIETISYLLERVVKMQVQISELNKQLSFYVQP